MEALWDLVARTPGLDASVFALLCAVSALTSAVSASAGLGGGAILVVVLASTLPAQAVVPVHAVIQIGSNLFRAVLLREDVRFDRFRPFAAGSVVGVAVGGPLAMALPAFGLEAIIGAFALYCVWGPPLPARSTSRGGFAALGLAASFATMFAGATGPLVAPVVRASCPDRKSTVATHAALMTWQHGVKIVGFGLLGFAYAPYLPLIGAMLVFGLLGTWCGRLLLDRLPERGFRVVFDGVLTLLALRLLFEAAHGAW